MGKRPEFDPEAALRRHFGGELDRERLAVAGIGAPATPPSPPSVRPKTGPRADSGLRPADFLAVAAFAAILGAAAFLEAGGFGSPRGEWRTYGISSMESCLRDYGTALGRAATSFSTEGGGQAREPLRGRIR